MPDDFILHDLEWTDGAENEPDAELVPCDDCGAQVPVNTLWDGVCRKCADEWRYIAGLLERERKGEKRSNDAENEPADEYNDITGGMYDGRDGEVDREWARALMEEDDSPVEAEDEELNDPLVKCRICRQLALISTMNTNGECPTCQRETALMIKPEGEHVTLEDNNGVIWKL